MENEMIKRVARAIADANMEDYDELKELHDALARAAIAAMREPTEAMIEVGNDQIDWWRGTHEKEWAPMPEDSTTCEEDVKDAYQAMIDAILKSE